MDKWVCFAEKEDEDEISRKVLKYFLEEVHYPQQNIINLPQSYKAASGTVQLRTSASKRSIRRSVITEKAPTRAFSWLKAATTAFTFNTVLRHYAK